MKSPTWFVLLGLFISSAVFAAGNQAECNQGLLKLDKDWAEAGGGTVRFGQNNHYNFSGGGASTGVYSDCTITQSSATLKRGNYKLWIKSSSGNAPPTGQFICTGAQYTTDEIQNRTRTETQTRTEQVPDPNDPNRMITQEVTEEVTINYRVKTANLITMTADCGDGTSSEFIQYLSLREPLAQEQVVSTEDSYPSTLAAR